MSFSLSHFSYLSRQKKTRGGRERSFHLASIISFWQLLYWIDNKEKHHYITKRKTTINRDLLVLLRLQHMTQLQSVSALCSLTFRGREREREKDNTIVRLIAIYIYIGGHLQESGGESGSSLILIHHLSSICQHPYNSLVGLMRVCEGRFGSTGNR